MGVVLLLVAAAAVYLLQCLFCRVLWRRRLTLSVSFSEAEVQEGQEVSLAETLENAKALSLPAVKVNIALGSGLVPEKQANFTSTDKNYCSEIFAMRRYEKVVRDIPVMCSKRGVYDIQDAEVIGNDLFYTRQFYHPVSLGARLCVLPGKADCRRVEVARRRLLRDRTVRTSDYEDPLVFRGIREYSSSDSFRDINWKATARAGELRVNMYERTADQELCIVLDTQWDLMLRPEGLLEESIRIAASLVDELVASGVPTSIVTNAEDGGTGERFRMGAGADARHVMGIRRGLARLELAQRQDPGSLQRMLSQLERESAAALGARVSWVLISTETSPAGVRAWERLAGEAADGLWILPAHGAESVPPGFLRRDDVMLWEVPRGK